MRTWEAAGKEGEAVGGSSGGLLPPGLSFFIQKVGAMPIPLLWGRAAERR